MKILWLSHLVPFPPKGGVLQRSFNLIKQMAKHHEITLIAFNQKALLESSLPDERSPIEYSKARLLDYVKSVEVLDIPEETIPKGRYLIALKALLKGQAYNMEWLISRQARSHISKVIEQTDFDLVHFDTISLAPYMDLIGKTPSVLNHHNFESEMLKSRSLTESNFLLSIFYKYESDRLFGSEERYCKRACLNITCSDDDSEMMRSKIPRANFDVVPNGVDIEYFYPSKEDQVRKGNIVLVGGLSWYPNREAVEYFIREIWPRIKAEFPDMTVDIVGRNPTREIIEFGESERNAQVHGFVDDVRSYLWQADFYFCPIRTGGGTKLKILDALAAGCCIISDPFACKGIAVEEGRHVLFAEEPGDYVNKIKAAKSDPEISKRLREEGPLLIKNKYSYESIGNSFSEMVSRLG
jgi:glycosyltransferase involved in cell wall biosynthesis